MSAINQLQDQINGLQLRINEIEAQIMSGACSLADPRGEQTKLMLRQQQLMQQQVCGSQRGAGGGAGGGADEAGQGAGQGADIEAQGAGQRAEQTPKDPPTGINRPPPPIPGVSQAPSVPASSTSQPDPSLSYKLCLSNQIAPISNFTQEINAASQATKVPADLIGAVIYKESQGNASLISGKPTAAHRTAGIALGLMQVEPNTSPEIEAKHPELDQLDGAAYDIMLGAWRLADLAQQFQGWDTVLRAYNSGAWAPVLKDPRAPITTGDPKYVYLVNEWWKRLSSGKQLPPSMNPED